MGKPVNKQKAYYHICKINFAKEILVIMAFLETENVTEVT